MKSRHYTAVKHAEGVTVTSRDPEAKQIFYGWGSDRNRDDGSFYGYTAAGGDPDYAVTTWTLSDSGVRLMIQNIDHHIGDKNYYSGRTEISRAKELSTLLKKVRR